ncbi:MAG TPA: HlyD family efflux transporter periplasmic adaptor subunit [Polyangiaceae bacterium]
MTLEPKKDEPVPELRPSPPLGAERSSQPPGAERPSRPFGGGRGRKRPSTARWLRRGGMALMAVGLAAALVLVARPKPLPVETVTVRKATLRVTVDEAGKTRVRDRYVVSAPLAGDLGRVELHPGDPVDKGAVLARLVPASPPLLDPRMRAEAKARILTTQAAAEQAHSAVLRAELARRHAEDDRAQLAELVAHGTVSQDAAAHVEFEARVRAEELSSARFGASMAAHEVEMARTALLRYGEGSGKAREEFQIPAPAAGRVLRVLSASAGVVQTGTPLVELGDPAALEVVVDVLTADAVRIAPRSRVILDRWGGAEPLAAHVRLVEPSAFTRVSSLGVEEQRVSVIVDLDDPREKWSALGDGYRVEASIVTWEASDVVTVPASAVFRRGDGWAVFVFDGGRARLRPVEIGRRGSTEVQALAGVAPGDRVIAHPSDLVADGSQVAVR